MLAKIAIIDARLFRSRFRTTQGRTYLIMRRLFRWFLLHTARVVELQLHMEW